MTSGMGDDGAKVEVSGGQGVQVGENNRQFNLYISNLAGDAAEPVLPTMLPRDTPGFTGRADELARITGLRRGGSAVVCTVDGAPGVGKTALTVHAAHMMSPDFPDGQLYA